MKEKFAKVDEEFETLDDDDERLRDKIDIDMECEKMGNEKKNFTLTKVTLQMLTSTDRADWKFGIKEAK